MIPLKCTHGKDQCATCRVDKLCGILEALSKLNAVEDKVGVMMWKFARHQGPKSGRDNT